MACPFYRERWSVDDERQEGRVLLYQVICLQNTPPETLGQQDRCMDARSACWRLKGQRKASAA